MATYTTNYNLKKPEYTDLVDVVDFNNNSDAIDTALKTIDNAVASKATKPTNEATASNGQVLTSNGDGTSTFANLVIPPTSNESYLAWVTNANSNSIDAAFGKNNETYLKGLGRQLAMYAWFKGANKTTYPFTNLINCNTLNDLTDSAKTEILSDVNLVSLFHSTNYAKDKLYLNFSTWKTNYQLMTNALTSASVVDTIRTTTSYHDILHTGRTVIETIGSGVYTVPSGVSVLTVVCIGGGASVNAGGYRQQVLSVTPGQQINYVVGDAGIATVFGSITAPAGETSSNIQSGKLIKSSTGGGVNSYGVPGVGGFGGGNGVGEYPGTGSLDLGTGGGGTCASRLTQRAGGGGGYGGGAGYNDYGGNGPAGQGVIAIFK